MSHIKDDIFLEWIFYFKTILRSNKSCYLVYSKGDVTDRDHPLNTHHNYSAHTKSMSIEGGIIGISLK